MKKIFLAFLLITAMMTFAQQDNFEISKSLSIYNNVFRELNMNYVDEIDASELNTVAIDAMLDQLDPYTVFIKESEIEDYRMMTTGEYGGIGAIIRLEGDYVHISEPYEGFPAHKAGLIAGDKILSINGIDTKGKNTQEVSELLKGQAGTTLEIVVSRYGEKNPITKTLTREKVKIDNIPYYGVFDNNIGYIALGQFTKNAATELKTAFIEMKQQTDLKGLVIDLRGNGGGLLKEAVDIVNIFVPKDKLVVYTKGKNVQQNSQHRTEFEPVDTEIPLVILVNGGSASASEIVAGSIQDFDRGVILGQRTFGKGLVQNILQMSYNTQIKVTVAKYYIPSNRCIQEIDYSKNKKKTTDSIAADTLGQRFTTANGRVVYEGHGIKPDVEVKIDQMSILTIMLYNKDMFAKFADKFFYEHKKIASADKFAIDDKLYQEFIDFVKEQGFTYTNESERILSELKKTVKREGNETMLSDEIDLMEKELANAKADDFNKSRKDIVEMLRMEIVSRYYFQKGKIVTSFTDDEELHEAFNVILDTERYNEILGRNK